MNITNDGFNLRGISNIPENSVGTKMFVDYSTNEYNAYKSYTTFIGIMKEVIDDKNVIKKGTLHIDSDVRKDCYISYDDKGRRVLLFITDNKSMFRFIENPGFIPELVIDKNVDNELIFTELPSPRKPITLDESDNISEEEILEEIKEFKLFTKDIIDNDDLGIPETISDEFISDEIALSEITAYGIDGVLYSIFPRKSDKFVVGRDLKRRKSKKLEKKIVGVKLYDGEDNVFFVYKDKRNRLWIEVIRQEDDEQNENMELPNNHYRINNSLLIDYLICQEEE